MRKKLVRGLAIITFLGGFLALCSPCRAELPFAKNGWTEREAACHLLSRFTFGAQPGEVDRVVKMGLESWLEQQLTATFPDAQLQGKLAALPQAYRLSNQQMLALYPAPAMLLRKAGVSQTGSAQERRAMLKQAREKAGARPIKELGAVLFAQKLYHARYSQAQLREVMTEFWFNHFNVALSNNRARRFLLSYERDAIRPYALDGFRTLLGKTAKHPAMLWYLDNATSTAGAEAATVGPRRPQLEKRKKGLNENYARELLELHTLGVDGGYTQADVTETARVLTGWTVVPYERQAQLRQLDRKGAALGMVRQGDFLFAGPLHDAGQKTVLGKTFVAGGGLEEGERLLDTLAAHPSTARHLARQMAVRFVSDEPSQALVDKLALVFRQSGGDTRAMLRAIACSDEFWAKSQRGSKVKSPFELVVSAARALGADLQPTAQLYDRLADMGQPLYNYQAPTGFPDQADAWISSGTVLQRMNFGLQAARGQVLGFFYSVPKRSGLEDVISSLLPEQSVTQVAEKLKPLLADPEALALEGSARPDGKGNLGGRLPGLATPRMSISAEQKGTATMIGLVLGSPEFQRR
jgi:uncharacterized protein (DUF1800 family)